MTIKKYAKELTKEYLDKCGIGRVEINPEDQTIILYNKYDRPLTVSVNNQGYKTINLFDPEYNRMNTFGLHRVVYAWVYDSVPEGMVVDHINNQHEDIWDYRPENLQLLTPGQNLAKERKPTQYRPYMPKKKQYTEEFLQDKIDYFSNRIEAVKSALRVCGSKEDRDYYNRIWHKERASLAQWKRRLQIFREEIK